MKLYCNGNAKFKTRESRKVAMTNASLQTIILVLKERQWVESHTSGSVFITVLIDMEIAAVPTHLCCAESTSNTIAVNSCTVKADSR